MTELRSACDLAADIRERRISAAEALDEHLARVAARNPALNAVVALDEAGARAAARAADEALATGAPTGPLHGVPMTIKDSYETAGLVTASGAPELAAHVPPRDADAVARLRAAGAVIFGKTNLPLMAGDVQSFNEVYGTTVNPWDAERTPGGSSGGAAAAVATGMTALELGSDIGGSIRTPSSWTGIYGHKASWGVVPLRGHIPGPPGTLTEVDLSVGGPMARDPRDLALGLDVLAGPRDWDATAWSLTLPPARATALRDFRVAAWLDDDAFPVDAAVRERLEALVEGLRGAGVAVDDQARPALTLTDSVGAYLPLLGAIIGGGFPQEVYDGLVAARAQFAPDDDSPMARFVRVMTGSARDVLYAGAWRDFQRAAWAAFFEQVDVLLAPVVPVPAIRHDQEQPMPLRTITVNGEQRPYLDLFSWIAPATACHLPATVAPIGRTASGLPVGVQIIGPNLEDRTTIAFAQALADEGLSVFEDPPAPA